MERNEEHGLQAIIADCMERNYALYKQGKTDELDFVNDMRLRDERLYDVRNLTGQGVRAAWNFGDEFFFSASHHDPNVNGIDWRDAEHMIEDTIQRLRSGNPIVEPRILSMSEG